jgi:hypothetical protein
MEVLRRKELERVVHEFAQAEPEPVARVAEVETPATVFVDALCPRCELPTRILVVINTELVTTLGGSEVRVKAKAKASSHTCWQQPLELEDSDQMSLSDIVGPTELVAVFRAGDAPKPEDVPGSRSKAERCGASAMAVDGDGEATEVVCGRVAGHDQLETEGASDHWAEGGYAWYMETRPVARDEEIVEGDEEAES